MEKAQIPSYLYQVNVPILGIRYTDCLWKGVVGILKPNNL